MKISFIGSGNVAWHLAQAFEDKGHHICEIYSKQLPHAKALVGKLFDAKAVVSLDFSDSVAELFILAVKDDAMPEILDQLILPENSILVHTSGAKPIDILQNWIDDIDDFNVKVGVFYPLMTFSKNKKLNFVEVPLCIEAKDDNTQQILVKIAQELSQIVYLVDTEERKILHVAAVFSNNFVNHLLAITQDLLIDNDLEMRLLKPIIQETIKKALTAADIHEVQTGPARRADQKTIKSHIELLKANPQAEKIYRVLSESIMNEFNP
jgi:predicted short-subunit dehydrogenase-like oxidoreductase (DUF2520 family)